VHEDQHRPWRSKVTLTCAILFVATAAVVAVVRSGDGPSPLFGRTFLSQSVTVAGEPYPLVDGTQVVLTFEDDGRVSASAGCNRHGGRVVIDGDRMVIRDSWKTAAGCFDARNAQDEWLSAVLAGDLRFVLEGPSLRLTSNDTVIELLDSETANPDRPLTETRWRLNALIDDKVTRPTGGAVATIVFREDRVDATIEGCVTSTATVAITGTRIQIGSLVGDRPACARAETNVHAAIAATLEGEIRYSIDADTLQLVHPDGHELVLHAA
jgi:heat shock protein HslJ